MVCRMHLHHALSFEPFSSIPSSTRKHANVVLQKYTLATTLALAASAFARLAPRAGKPTGGPFIANVTVWSGGNFSCESESTVVPNDGTAILQGRRLWFPRRPGNLGCRVRKLGRRGRNAELSASPQELHFWRHVYPYGLKWDQL